MNHQFKAVLLAAGVLLSVSTGCSDDTRVVTVKENGATIELAVGERVRFELEAPVERKWQRIVETEPFVLKELEARVEVGEWEKTLSIAEFEATGGGEQELVFWERYTNVHNEPVSTIKPSVTFTVKVAGASREDEIFALYKGFVPVGGFGTSRKNGRPIRELALFPSDLVAGVDGDLYVASEERIWRIDTEARTGTVFIDKTRADGPLPSGAVVTALDQRGTADWLLGLRAGTTNTVGWLRANDVWEPLQSWESARSIHRVRIAPDGVGWAAVDRDPASGSIQQSEPFPRKTCEGIACGKGEPDAIEFGADGTLFVRGLFSSGKTSILVGRDAGNNPLLFTDDYPNGLQRLNGATNTPVLLFEVIGVPGDTPTENVYRPTDFYAAMPEMTIGAGTSSKFTWPAQKAAVAQTADGAYWASGVRTVQEPPDYRGYNQGRGLYVHE